MCQCSPECRINSFAIFCIISNAITILGGISRMLYEPKSKTEVGTTTESRRNMSEEELLKQKIIEMAEKRRKHEKLMAVIFLVKGSIGLIFTVLLLVGVIKENETLVKIFFFYGILNCLYFAIMAILTFVLELIGEGVIHIIVLIIYAVLLHFIVKKYLDTM